MAKIRRTETRYLPCKLTDGELRSTSDELAAVTQEINVEEANQKTRKDEMKMKMSSLQSRQRSLAVKVSSRSEERLVKIEISGNDDGAVIETRIDTGEIICTREPKPEERQLGL